MATLNETGLARRTDVAVAQPSRFPGAVENTTGDGGFTLAEYE